MKSPEQKARDAARVKAWKLAHPERVRQLNAESLARRPRQHTPEQRAAAVDRTRRWGEQNPERRAELRRETVRRYHAKYPERTKQRFRSWVLRTKYNISWEQYHEMLDVQGGKCAICGTEEPGGRGAFPVDHDHATGKVRALLCNQCNQGLGHFGDDSLRLRAAADYVERHRS